MKIKDNFQKNSGFALTELLVYIAGLLTLGTVLIVIISQFYSLYREIIIVPRVDRTGVILIDRFSKEMRSAKVVDLLESQFGTTEGILDFDVVQEGVLINKRIYVENGIIKYKEGTSDAVSLNSEDIYVSNFNLDFVPTSVSQAVRLTIEIQYTINNKIETKTYRGFAILRESYE